MYYEINEETARRAKEMSSFFEYKPGSVTAAYKVEVDAAAEIAHRQSTRYPEHAEKIAALLDRYARNLAAWYNKENEISCRCPSVMIAGPANFPVRKKQKQVAAWDKNREFYDQTQDLLRRIRTIGTGGIQSNDPAALEKLAAKLERLQKAHQAMKQANADARKQGKEPPYKSWALSNSSANIRRIQGRIAGLESAKHTQTAETCEERYTCREDTQLMRVQFIFDDKPKEEIRALLKANGFRWAPSQGAWQRQLNGSGKLAALTVQKSLKK